MAAATTFKQQCPSCEAMVSIKENMIGKKVECHKCKDKFVAKKPTEADDDIVDIDLAAEDDDDDVVDADIEEVDEAPANKNTKVGAKKSTAVPSKPPANDKRPKLAVKDEEEADEDEVAEDEEEDEKPQVKNGKAKSASNGKPAKKIAPHDDDDDEDEEDDEEEDDEESTGKKSKKEGKSNKLVLGLVLAGVGVVILGVAAFLFMGGRGPRNTPAPNNAKGGNQNKDNNDLPPPKIDFRPPEPVVAALNEAELAKLSNLLPTDAEHVFRVAFRDLFAPNSSLRNAVFETPGGLNDADLRKQLGFSVLAIDDVIHAKKYTFPSWRFTVIHFNEAVNERDMKNALKLESAGAGIDGQTYFKQTKAHPALDQLARFSFGIPNYYRYFEAPTDSATLVRLHNPQTLIVGDAAPVLAFLKVKGQFPLQTNRQPVAAPPDPGRVPVPDAPPMPAPPPGPGKNGALPASEGKLEFTLFTDQPPADPRGRKGKGPNPPPPPKDPTPNDPNPNPLPKDPNPNPLPGDPNPPPPSKEPNPNIGAGGREDTYLTIKPSLKAMLDKMELRANDKDRTLFSSATDMDANTVDPKDTGVKDMVIRLPRQFWDVSLLVYEPKPRIRFLGTALVQRDTLRYQLRNELSCGMELDAKEFQKEMVERTSLVVARFIQQLVKHEVKLPTLVEKKAPMPPAQPLPPPGKDPPKEAKKPSEAVVSQISVNQQGTSVEFILDLVLDNPTLTQAHGIAALTAAVMRAEIDGAAARSSRHLLAEAGRALGEKGLPDAGGIPQRKFPQIPKGQFPPGAFPRATPAYIEREPRNRISWMAGLLPYLGQQNLYSKMHFDQSWRDSSNWLVGHTTVPQFLDPMYPDTTRQAMVSDLPLDFGATHYVGIAGVGLDAATYRRGDPATLHKQGILGYDGSASLEDVVKGRGAANTIFMIQVPYDRGAGAGVAPWIAGGGATLRGVPEKNSIEPFILGKDRNDKIIQYQAKKGTPVRGTYAVMADGSVRFIDQTVSDDVFKAMCTVNGPAPADFSPKLDPKTPLVPVPADFSKDVLQKKPADGPPAKVDPKKNPEPSARHKGEGRLHDPGAGFSIVPPAGWQKAENKGGAFLVATGPPDAIPPNLNVVAAVNDGTPIEKSAADLKKALAANKAAILDDAFVTLDAKKAYTICWRLVVQIDGKTLETQTLQYFIPGNAGRGYVLTFTTAPQAFAQNRKAMEQSALTVQAD